METREGLNATLGHLGWRSFHPVSVHLGDPLGGPGGGAVCLVGQSTPPAEPRSAEASKTYARWSPRCGILCP